MNDLLCKALAKDRLPLMVWATAADIRERIAGVPNNWLVRFINRFPHDVRKMGGSRNATLLFRVSTVLKAIEERALERTGSDEERDFDVRTGAAKEGGAAGGTAEAEAVAVASGVAAADADAQGAEDAQGSLN